MKPGRAPEQTPAGLVGWILVAIIVTALAAFMFLGCSDSDDTRVITEIVCPQGQEGKHAPCCAVLEDGARVLVSPETQIGQSWGTGTACPEEPQDVEPAK